MLFLAGDMFNGGIFGLLPGLFGGHFLLGGTLFLGTQDLFFGAFFC